jgi:hypothetical protein
VWVPQIIERLQGVRVFASEPSSAMISSQSVKIWAKRESIAGVRNCRRLKVGLMTEMSGMVSDSACAQRTVRSDGLAASGAPCAPDHVPVHRRELRPERIERQLPIEVRAHCSTLLIAGGCGD